MRRIVLAVVVCFTLVAVAGAVTMVPPSQDKPAQQVEVVNFPAVQPASGTVSVGNLPAVQAVSGSVQVSNLPLDANGNIKVTAPAPATLHFVGFSSPVPLSATWLVGSRQCAADFPGARACTVEDFYNSTTVPPPFPVQALGTGWVRMISRHPDTGEVTSRDFPFTQCLRSDGELDNPGCFNTVGVTDTPFACCGL